MGSSMPTLTSNDVMAITKWSIPFREKGLGPGQPAREAAYRRAGFLAPFQQKLINCRWFSSCGPQGRRRTEHAYAPDPRYGRFPEEACHPSARDLSGRRVRAHRRLDDRPAADP